MFKVERRGMLGYEDLMHELESFEQDLFEEHPGMAMNLMVLEAKIRERFQRMEGHIWEKYSTLCADENPSENDLSEAEIEAMIPKDLVLFPSIEALKDVKKRKQTMQTIGMAAALAVLTAIGVFGLASILQLTISWLA